MKLKPEKCYLVGNEVLYLGYVVSRQGVSADPTKIEAVQRFPQSSDMRSLYFFLVLPSYYRRFIQNFSTVASPVYALTRKDVEFLWEPVHQDAICHLKQLLINAPVLAFPDFTQDFVLETDVSGVGLGAIFAQAQEDRTTHPIALLC